MFLDGILDFDEHIKGIIDKTSISIGLILKFWNLIPTSLLLQIHKFLVGPCLDYGCIIYEKAFIGSFQEKPESI